MAIIKIKSSSRLFWFYFKALKINVEHRLIRDPAPPLLPKSPIMRNGNIHPHEDFMEMSKTALLIIAKGEITHTTINR